MPTEVEKEAKANADRLQKEHEERVAAYYAQEEALQPTPTQAENDRAKLNALSEEEPKPAKKGEDREAKAASDQSADYVTRGASKKD